ncbi:AC transposable element-derived protein 4 [Fusarium oxysporum f. sp. phaseoli]
MNSPPILEEIHVINPYDDNSFIKEEYSHCLWQGDPTLAVDLLAENDRGTNFRPFHVETRNFRISPLPPTPLQLFQLFLSISLVEKWVSYTNSWTTCLKENDVVDSWKNPMGTTSKLHKWEGTTVSEVLTTIGVLIYMGVHKEKTIRSYWNPPKPVSTAWKWMVRASISIHFHPFHGAGRYIIHPSTPGFRGNGSRGMD